MNNRVENVVLPVLVGVAVTRMEPAGVFLLAAGLLIPCIIIRYLRYLAIHTGHVTPEQGDLVDMLEVKVPHLEPYVCPAGNGHCWSNCCVDE
jgi:hypothetical protein